MLQESFIILRKIEIILRIFLVTLGKLHYCFNQYKSLLKDIMNHFNTFSIVLKYYNSFMLTTYYKVNAILMH